MKSKSKCIVGDIHCSSEAGDDPMDCTDYIDLAELTERLQDGDVDIYDMAERLTALLGRPEEVPDCSDDSPVLAGYADCTREAVRYLVEEEQYSPEHPLVLGLRQHLAAQRDRLLIEQGLLDNRVALDQELLDNRVVVDNRPVLDPDLMDNRLLKDNNGQPDIHRAVMLLADSFCDIRPSST